ncbi:MAG: peptidase S9 family protein [Chthoniobacterales bacterium]|nr:MAG: peptidase S9 family protein [Chthoniobacterales bacterium]
MKHLIIISLVTAFEGALAVTPSPSPGPAKRLLKAEDFAGIRDVDEPNISPDGKSIVYVVKAADMEKDKLAGNLWLVRWDGTENRALTFGNKGASHPRWSPDGKWVAFLSGREDENEVDQLWILPSDGGEAQKFTDAKGGVDDFAWAPDSTRIALVVKDPDPREPEKKEKEKKTVAPLVIDRFQFKQDIEGYLTDRYSHLQLLELTTRKIESLTSGKHDDLLPAWSPDGNQIAFVSKRGDDPDRSENWDVYLIEARGGAKESQLTTSPEADPLPDWASAPAWSPDGKSIAYIHGGDPKKIEYAVHTLATVPAGGGAAEILTPTLDRNVVEPHWSTDGKAIFAVIEDDGAELLARIPVDGGAPQAIAKGRRKVTAYDVAKNGNTIVRASTPDRPYEIFAVQDNNLRCLSSQNDAWLSQFKLGQSEETKFKSADGTEVHGFVIRPANAAAGKAPALLRPHGGPQSQYANEFDFEKQLFAANGYAAIMPNPRGSTGRGEKFAMGIYADWGHRDVEDDLAAIDDAVARGIADPERLGVGGWSYGGISTNYIIATTTRFKAATSGASISNVLAGYGTDQYTRDYEAELGLPWENAETWMRISYPFLHADRIKTPTLFLCGENDFNVPLLNTEQMYQALRSLGVPTELVIYPGQFHGLKKPSYIIDRFKRYLDWYGRWLFSARSAAGDGLQLQRFDSSFRYLTIANE